MDLRSSGRRGRRTAYGSATVAFAFILTVVGGIGATWGSEAGLLALVLALVALVAAPYVYSSVPGRRDGLHRSAASPDPLENRSSE